MKGQKQSRTDALEKRMAATTNVLQQIINEINNLKTMVFGQQEIIKQLEEAIKDGYYSYFASDGFFWGQQFQEEQVTEYAEQDQKFINWCKDQLKENQNIGYDCSW